MNMRENIENALRDGLSGLEAAGVLCALNIDGEASTYSSGNIAPAEHGLPFYIYSISKSITATAVMLLVEQGRVDLDEAIPHWELSYDLPEGVTVRQLLNHTGGLSDYFSSQQYQEAVHAHPSDPWSYEKLMQVGLADTPLFSPGEGWSYSNPGYAILKELVEKRSGEGYYAYVARAILEPLGMSHTQPFDRLDHGVGLLAGMDPAMHGDFRTLYDPGWIVTGSFISTASDVTRFYHSLFSGQLLGGASLQEMQTTVPVPFPCEAPREPRYGLGLMSFDHDPHGENYGHGGGGPGYTNYAQHCLDFLGRQVTVVMVVNATLSSTPFGMAHRVLDCLGESV